MSSTQTIFINDTFLDEFGEITTPTKQCINAISTVDKLFLSGIRKISLPLKVAGVITFQERVQLILDSQFGHADNIPLLSELSEMLSNAKKSIRIITKSKVELSALGKFNLALEKANNISYENILPLEIAALAMTNENSTIEDIAMWLAAKQKDKKDHPEYEDNLIETRKLIGLI